ncbi:MAG: 1,4-dihydroxy-2-naphthoate polyprenyltransferase [Actinomycetales bacterium]
MTTTATLSDWVTGARVRTLPAAVAPVVVASALAAAMGSFYPVRALLALIVLLALQVGVNYANDYSDGIRGTDARRVGPTRLVASGLVPATTVKRAAFACFGIGVAAGLVLLIISRAWIYLPVGAMMPVLAWFYTGGKRPYGYRGFGEVAVLVAFGLVPVTGTVYTQVGRLDGPTWALAFAMGLLAAALLVANNLRDIPTDREHGKVTLAVRLGDATTRRLYVAMVLVAYLLLIPVVWAYPWALLGLLSLPLAVAPVRAVLSGQRGRDLVPVLAGTTTLELGYALLVSAGLVLS